jgi:hypothetical protein
MVRPMTDFVGKRKSLPRRGAILVNGDDRGVVTSDDPRFTAFRLTEPDAGSEMKGDGLKINFLRFADT